MTGKVLHRELNIENDTFIEGECNLNVNIVRLKCLLHQDLTVPECYGD